MRECRHVREDLVERGHEAHASTILANALAAEGLELLREEGLGAAGAGGEDGKADGHGAGAISQTTNDQLSPSPRGGEGRGEG